MTDSTTLLSLAGVGVPLYSARGLTQTLEPISGAANQSRTINGRLKDLSVDQFRKFQSTITGNDQQPPACDGVWPGHIVVVDCIAELCYLTASSEDGSESADGMPSHEAVPGSIRDEGGFTFYRPRLTMMVTGFQMNKDEWNAGVSWSLSLEEV